MSLRGDLSVKFPHVHLPFGPYGIDELPFPFSSNNNNASIFLINNYVIGVYYSITTGMRK